MSLFIRVDEEAQRFCEISQGMSLVLADLIDYLIENGHGFSIVPLGAEHAERNESTKPPIGGLGFTDKCGRHRYLLQWLRLHGTAARFSDFNRANAGAFNSGGQRTFPGQRKFRAPTRWRLPI